MIFMMMMMMGVKFNDDLYTADGYDDVNDDFHRPC
jgi:hypothetical protein